MAKIALTQDDPHEYWKGPLTPLGPGYMRDPKPDVGGLLTADWIKYYADVAGMIQPFVDAQLKPASYDLTLGPLCQLEGRERILRRPGDILEIPPNSIVFVSMNERLCIPYYMIGRFNLAIEFVYKGLLLGTGPQVDPGFQGVLSCPLHNISNNPIRIRRGQHFATIDFTKTTPLGPVADAFKTPESFEAAAAQGTLLGSSGNAIKIFSRSKSWQQPIFSYPAGEIRVSSSVAPLAKSVRRLRRLGFVGAVVGFIGVLFSLASLAATFMGAQKSSDQVVSAASAAVRDTEQDVHQLREQIKVLEDRVRALEGSRAQQPPPRSRTSR
jgi:deoxycytidine triphosphate deaminase